MTTGPASPDPGQDDDAARRAGESAGSPPADPAPSPGGSGSGRGAQPTPDDERPGEGRRELRPSIEDCLTEEEWLAWLPPVDPDEMPAEDDDPGLPDPSQPGTRKKRSPRPGQGSRAPAGFPRKPPSARRGPGEPASAHRIPGDSPGPAGAFATGQPLDTAPGSAALHGLAEYAAGSNDRFTGASDDELTGVICALDRAEAAACALKHAAVAELIRRRPEPGCDPEGPAQMPATWEEFTEDELRDALAETRYVAAGILGLAHDLETKLPGTRAAFRAGMLRQSKAEIIARATANLDPDEAQAAEALVLGRAGRLTPGGLRAAIAQAVLQVNPEKAVKRRETAEQDARVQRWREDSGNAALMGRELPPDEVLAADQRISWWARELKKAGLEGDMDVLRARAYLDLLLSKDSRPAVPSAEPAAGRDNDGSESRAPATPGDGGSADPGDGRSPAPEPGGVGLPPTAGVLPAGFAGRINLTIPLTTLLDLAERPGELSGLGPVDPKPKANTSDCYRSQVRADPARRAWRTSAVDALVSHMRAFSESGAAPPGWGSPVRA